MAERKETQGEDFQHIVRVGNADLDGRKSVLYGMKKVKGVGYLFARAVCHSASVDHTRKLGSLKTEELRRLDQVLAKPGSFGIPEWMFNHRKEFSTGEDRHLISSDLLIGVENDLKRVKKIKSYKGVRHMLGQPVRGQRTRSNFRKNKGKVLGVKRAK